MKEKESSHTEERVTILVSKELRDKIDKAADSVGLAPTSFIRMKLHEIVREIEL